jgi:magnesium transporter
MSDQIPTPASVPMNQEERNSLVLELLKSSDLDTLLLHLETWTAGEVSTVIGALPPPYRMQLWGTLKEECRGEILAWLPDPIRSGLIDEMEETEVIAAASTMESADLAGMLESVSDQLGEAILESLDDSERTHIERQLTYSEHTAGRIMRTEWVAVRADVSLETVARYLRRRGEVPEQTDGLMVVNRDGIYLGKLPLDTLLTMNTALSVEEVMLKGSDYVFTETDNSEIALMFERRELLSLAVLDSDYRLLGRITVDDAMPLIRAEAEAPLMQMAGLQEDEDLFAPILPSAGRRMFWLAINLATAFLASWVIGLFEATLQQIVALAVLMPIVASMGGISGSQTLTLAIRGLALGQITDANTRWLATKEVAIAAINGITWALVVGLIAWLWFGQPGISLVLGAAMVINLLAASISGIAVPLVLRRAGIDPALSGSVILTTVTDVVGFMSFLGLASWLLLG